MTDTTRTVHAATDAAVSDSERPPTFVRTLGLGGGRRAEGLSSEEGTRRASAAKDSHTRVRAVARQRAARPARQRCLVAHTHREERG